MADEATEPQSAVHVAPPEPPPTPDAGVEVEGVVVGVVEAVVHGVDGPLAVTQSHKAATELRTGTAVTPQAPRTQSAAAP